MRRRLLGPVLVVAATALVLRLDVFRDGTAPPVVRDPATPLVDPPQRAAFPLFQRLAVGGSGPAPPSPAQSATFGGLDARQLPGVNPADVQIAVGNGMVVQTVNSSIAVWTTDGRLLRSQSLAEFFSGTGVDRSRDAMTDPRVLWDPVSGRFFAAVFDITRLELDVGVSTSADPLGPWTVYSLPSSGCPDQPRLGTSDVAVVVTDDLFSACRSRGRFLGGEVHVLSKADMLAGAAAPRRANLGPDSRFGAITPAAALVSTPVVYLTSVSQTGGSLNVFAIDSPSPTSLPFKQVALRSALTEPGDSPQRGSAMPLDSGDDRVQNAVYDGTTLFVTASEACGSNGARACGRVIGLDPRTPRLVRDTTVVLPGSRSLLYPAVAPDSRGNVVVGFVYTSPTDFPGLGYTYVRPDGVVAAPRDLVPGSAPNESGRFGDYSGAARDPVDPSTVWVGAEIGQAADGTLESWGSGIASVRVPPQPPAVVATRAVVRGSTASASAELFVEGLPTRYRFEYGAGGSFGSRTATATVSGDGRSEPIAGVLRGLLPGTVHSVRVVATNAAGTSTGAPATFRTAPGPPRVSYAAPAAKRVRGTAVVRALVTSAGAATRVAFEYGRTRAYGKRTGSILVAAAARASLVVARVPALAPGDHFRVVAANAQGRSAGRDRVAPR